MSQSNYTCAICGAVFIPLHSKHKYCSKRCRKIAIKQNYKRAKAYCRTCGVALPDGRQQYCIDCLLKDYKKTRTELAYKRLRNRGYDKELIQQEIKEKGI